MVKNILKVNLSKYFILITYFSLHMTNLTLLPIFNDESIYLDWAWTMTHIPGHLYDSLLDAKQPLMFWIFGIFENFFADPLIAGRLTSVFIGAVTALGIYRVTSRLLDDYSAIIATLLYSIIPIFVFYNRQALMEAGIACIGVWSLNALLNLIQNPTVRNGIILGVILGLGFLIKTSSLLFIISATLIILLFIFKIRNTKLIKTYLISIASILGLNFLLFINPIFWQTFSTNSRYSFTLRELVTFPFSTWWNHLVGFFEIAFIFVTPLVFLCSIVGIFLMIKMRLKNSQVFLAYFITALGLEIVLGRFQHQRYILPFITFLVIPASYVLSILWKDKIIKKSLVIVVFLIPFILTLLLIFNPEYHIMQLSKISNYSEMGYVKGQTSGYGIKETINYIKENSSSSHLVMILLGLGSGNPENAIRLYTQKTSNLVALRTDSKLFQGLDQYECLSSKYKVFFVTRNDQLWGMERYFNEVISYNNPDKLYSVRIYKLNKNCKGNYLSLSDIYQPAIDKVLEMR